MPVDAAFAVTSAEWSMPAPLAPGAGAADVAEGAGRAGAATFGSALSGALGELTRSQQEGAAAAQSLAAGTATDPTAVVLAVERAQLAMQLAGQIRTKSVESVQDVFRTQV